LVAGESGDLGKHRECHLSSACGAPVEGGYRVVELWQTREAADAFYNSDLYRTATITVTAQPKILMTWPVEGVDNGNGWHSV
jgi:hypothetical protein